MLPSATPDPAARVLIGSGAPRGAIFIVSNYVHEMQLCLFIQTTLFHELICHDKTLQVLLKKIKLSSS
jgi:hypothetical protein